MEALTIKTIKPFDEAIVPGIEVIIEHEFQEDVLMFATGGYVLAADRKIVGNLIPVPPQIFPASRVSDRVVVGRYIPRSVSDQRARENHPFFRMQRFYCPLDATALGYIENLRQMDPKKDVHLEFVLTCSFATANVCMGDFQLGNRIGRGDQYPVISSYGQGDTSRDNLRILVWPSRGSLLEMNSTTASLAYTIKVNDWLYDFAPVLGLGRFLVLEILKPDIAMVKPSELSAEVKEFLERLERARGILDQMDKDLLSGEWREVVKKSREFWELFLKESDQLNVKSFIKEFISGTTGLNEKQGENVLGVAGRLYGYASDLFIHPIDKASGVKEIFTGGKEDAYLSYTLAASFLNMLLSKFKKSLQEVSRRIGDDK
ncbi:MAG: hypothetical protein DDT25_01276 [Chloroflexi bacterium]|nr:hypothetical protein [Chloroflexota bacterium]